MLGCFPLYPPLELFHSMGLEPLVLWGMKPFLADTARSDQHLQSFVCSVGRHLTEFVLSKEGALIDGFFMYNACDTLRNLPEILRSGLEERGHRSPILNMHIPMPSLGQTDARQYLSKEIDRLIDQLSDAFGVSFLQSRFESSVALYAQARELARQLETAVTMGRLRFGAFAGLIQGNAFRSVEGQIGAMSSLLSDEGQVVGDRVGNRSAIDIILSGILPPPAGVSDIIEDAGLNVVGNDIASLARSYGYTPGNETWRSPSDYYVDFYYHHHPCPTLLGSSDRRIDTLEALIRERGARGIIFLGEKFCEYEYFEFPYLMKRFKENGIASLLLEFAIDDDENLGPMRTRIEAFAEMLREGDKT